jgi:superfamily II DNA or RNA helicase
MQTALFGDKPTKHQPRYYQAEAIQSTEQKFFDEKFQRSLVVLPTGMGKTNVMVWQAARMADRGKQLVTVHREELIEQIIQRFHLLAPSLHVTQEGAGKRGDLGADITVSSIQTVSRDDSKYIERYQPSHIITDEAHRGAARTYMQLYDRAGCFHGDCLSTGYTATPHRRDKRAVWGHEQAPFQVVAYSKTLRDAIAEGWACDIIGYRQASNVDLAKVKSKMGDYDQAQLEKAVNVQVRNQLAYDTWKSVASSRSTIIFCVTVDHAMTIAEIFQSKGVAAEVVYGDMKSDDRKRIFDGYRDGSIQVLVNVDIVTEGVDVPNCSCVLILRPTKSFGLYTQMVGRGLRPYPGCINGMEEKDQAADRIASIQNSPKPDCMIIEIVDADTRKKKDEPEDEDPSTASIFGLPPKLNLNGETITKAIREVDLISKEALSILLSRDLDMTTLSEELKSISILDELEIANKILDGAGLSWIKLATDTVGLYLDCGRGRSFSLTEDAVGNWSMSITDGANRRSWSNIASTEGEALRKAEAAVHKIWPDCIRQVKRVNKWREQRITDRQVFKLTSLGQDKGIIQNLTRGEASQLIVMLEQRVQR